MITMNNFSKIVSSFRLRSSLQFFKSIRPLYNTTSIGIDDYVKVRDRYNAKPEFFDKFRQKMTEICEAGEEAGTDGMIFTDDLRQFVHIVNPTPEDFTLLEKMMIKFNKQNAQLRFGTFTFGPVIMRLYHYFNKPDEALKVYYNPELDGFFDQISSYVVLMDLLFRNGKYHEIVDLYKVYRERQLSFGKYPKSVMILVFGSFYKINTEESFKTVLDLWKEMNDVGLVPLRRVTLFSAALAVNQNNPHIALEILSTIPNSNFVLVRCLKVLAFAALKRIDDVLPILTSVFSYDAPNITKQTFPKDVLESVKEIIEKQGTKEVKHEFDRIEKQLKEQGYLTQQKLDDLLMSEITLSTPESRTRFVLNRDANSVNKQPYRIFKRPSLLETI